jgi:hypothetical protein
MGIFLFFFEDRLPVLKRGLLFDERRGPTTAVYYRRLLSAIQLFVTTKVFRLFGFQRSEVRHFLTCQYAFITSVLSCVDFSQYNGVDFKVG